MYYVIIGQSDASCPTFIDSRLSVVLKLFPTLPLTQQVYRLFQSFFKGLLAFNK